MKKILGLITIFMSLTIASYGDELNIEKLNNSDTVIEGETLSLDTTNKKLVETPVEKVESYDEYMKKANNSYEKKDYGDSLDNFLRAYKTKDQDVDALLGAAKAYEAMGEKDEALGVYRKVLKYSPKNTVAVRKEMLLEGDYVGRWGDRQKEAYFNKFESYLKKENYSNSEDIYILGRVYMDDKSFERAFNVFKREPNNDYRNLFGAGSTANFLGNHDVAITFYEKAIAAKPDFNRSYLGIATAYKLTGDYDTAIENMRVYLEHEKDPNVYVGISDIYMAQKKLNSARDILEEGQKEFPNSSRIRESLGDIYSKLGR